MKWMRVSFVGDLCIANTSAGVDSNRAHARSLFQFRLLAAFADLAFFADLPNLALRRSTAP
jgi:hypothetical protein